ncbi:MAG TPA: glycosyltransferase family 4 protein [Vicinamibacterales bacterium]|nr:glycosyltransferase family 4 protein [Vicinamibacterales bacterium]
MRVLCFADTRFPIERANGVQTFQTCHALARRGHDVTLAVRTDTAKPPRDPFNFYGLAAEPRLHVRTLPAPGPPKARRVAYLAGALRLATSAPTATVVFTRDLGLAAWLLQWPKSRRPRVVYESHGISAAVAREMPVLLGKPELLPSASKLRRLERREERVWKHASAYVGITHALVGDLRSLFGEREHVFVAPDGASPAGLLPGPAADRFIAGYAGHLYPWKGVDVFVRSLAHAPGVHGLIVGGHPGEADLERVMRLAGELGLRDRLTITGLVAPTEVRRAVAPATVLVLPNPASTISERYTSPLKLFEYLTMGRAIVASDLTSVREVVEDGRTALLVPPGDERALGAALGRLRDNPAMATSLGQAALALAAAYSWDARASRIEAALEAALAS